jgi:hypothetical protein
MTSGGAPQPMHPVHSQFLRCDRPLGYPFHGNAPRIWHAETAPIRQGSAGNTKATNEGIKPTGSCDCTGQRISHDATMQDFCMDCQRTYEWNSPTQAGSISAMPPTPHKVFVGNNLRLAIEALGLSQAEFSRRTKIATNKLHNYLRGDNYPDPLWLARVCDEFGLTTDWFYRGVRAGVAAAVAENLRAAAPA